jgi:hypothetical protein
MTADPPLFSSCSIFLVNPLPTGVYFDLQPLILDGFLKFGVSLLISKNRYQNSLSFFTIVADLFLVRRVVFMLYNYSYLHLGPIFFKCIHFAPTSF